MLTIVVPSTMTLCCLDQGGFMGKPSLFILGFLGMLRATEDFEGFLAHLPTQEKQSTPHMQDAQEMPKTQPQSHTPSPPLDAQTLQKQVIQQEKQKLKAQRQARAMLIKNGWFLGTEITISRTDVQQDFDRVNGATDALVFYQGRAQRANFNMGVVGGYQHYFGNTQKHGIKMSAHLYGGTPSVVDTPMRDVRTSLTTTYTPLSFGLDVKYVYDFFNHMGKHRHTLGLSVGVGWRMYEYFARIQALHTRIGVLTPSNPQNIFNQGFYPTIGLHYYVNHHQFAINYRFGGAIHYTSSVKSTIQEKSGRFKAEVLFDSFRTKLNNSSYISLNYAYLF